MGEYKITRVSSQPPREWSFADRKTGNDVPMLTYKVMIEGQEEAVDVNRKAEGDAPKAGDVLSGTLEQTDFGYKFKPERKPFTPGGRDTTEIRAQMSIKEANRWIANDPNSKHTMEELESTAKQIYSMVDRVKGSSSAPVTEQSGYEKAKSAAEKIKKTFSDGSPVTDDDAPINLDDIPF